MKMKAKANTFKLDISSLICYMCDVKFFYTYSCFTASGYPEEVNGYNPLIFISMKIHANVRNMTVVFLRIFHKNL